MESNKFLICFVEPREVRFYVNQIVFYSFFFCSWYRWSPFLGRCDFISEWIPVFLLANRLPNKDVVDRRSRKIKLKCQVFTGSIHNGMWTIHECIDWSMSDNFIIPILNSHCVPRILFRYAHTFTEVRGNKASVTITWCVDLKIVWADLGNAVVMTPTPSNQADVRCSIWKLEIKLNNRVVKRSVLDPHATIFSWIEIGSLEAAITETKVSFEGPSIWDSIWIKSFRKDTFTG